ncbi:MAG TPA: acetate--CoA ligase family protein, partial [Stellaceae bacterium]|nr:acetate--CoA ligase family protein [Stellaceae bacterium]
TIPSDLARRRLAEAGIIIQGSLSWLARSVRALASETPAPSRPKTLPRPPAVASALAAAGGTLAEHRAREILGAFGLAQSPYALVRGPEDLAAVTLGFPLALKIQSPDIPHKTEIGGVQLGLRDHRALVEAYGAMMEKIRHLRPKARIDGVLLQPMAKRGVEMIIGTVCDPQFGPLIMVGAGGVAAELARDTAWRLAPVEENEARAMIEELRVANLFQGFRGARPHDRASLVALIVRLSEFAAAFADRVREVELNPVMIHGEGEGCTILDALMTVKEID